MYQHGTIFSLNNIMFIYMVWTREIHILIQVLKYIWFYHLYILKYISCTSFRKGEHVYRTKLTYTIGSTKYGNEEQGNL